MKRYLTAIAAGLALLATSAVAQTYPNKAIRIVVPYPAGGLADNVTRMIGEKLSTKLGQPVIVDNRPGGKQIIATDAVVKSPADGYTLLLGSVTNLAINPVGLSKLSYNVEKDLTPVAHLFYSPLLLVTKLPTNTVKDFVGTLKAAPGKHAYASVGPGTSTHIAGEFMAKSAGLDVTHVPYKGSAHGITDLVGGQVDFMFDGGTSALPFVHNGRLKLLAVTSAQRFPTLPNTPTMIESGFKDFEVTAWWGLMAPANTPKDVVSKLYASLSEITQDKALQEHLLGNGVALDAKSPEAFGSFIKQEQMRWGKFLTTTGIQINN
jgi:tripartite-type tricarboxylate transporter receptor subunit TctC